MLFELYLESDISGIFFFRLLVALDQWPSYIRMEDAADGSTWQE